MKRESLESKANRLYEWILAYVKDQARSPSQREMCKALQIAPDTLQDILRLLVAQKRAIHRIGRHRQIWPLKGAHFPDAAD